MKSVPQFQTLLSLGRVSNLPTLWSNCLAGWWLGGGGNDGKLPFLFSGISLLFTGGAFLNDAFDAEFDRRHRPERPVPAGHISLAVVWRLGLGQLVAGIFLLIFCGQLAAGAAILLALSILLYNFSHKFFTAAPWILGGCRFWVYIIAGATGTFGLNGWPIYCGTALALYVAGQSQMARRENFRFALPHWPLLLLAAPVVLAMAMNFGTARTTALWLAILQVSWVIYSMRTLFWGREVNGKHLVMDLIAGMVLVDWLAVGPMIPHWTGILLFPLLFGMTKWLQKFAPTG